MEQVLTTLVFIGGLAGLPIAIYFTLSFYFGDRSVFLIRFAKACNTDHGTCLLVIRTPYARVFKLPNSLFGVIYYIGLVVLVIIRLFTGEIPFLPAAVVIASLGAAFSVFLTWALLRQLKAP